MQFACKECEAAHCTKDIINGVNELAKLYDGTSAYQLEYDYEEQLVEVNDRAKQRRWRKRRFIKRVRLIFCLGIVFAIACGVLYGNARIIQASSRVSELQAELKKVTEDNTQKLLDLEKSLDLKKVEEIATTELGMKRPEKYQIVYVDVQQNDYGEVTQTEKPEPLQGTFGAIRQSISAFLAYFN